MQKPDDHLSSGFFVFSPGSVSDWDILFFYLSCPAFAAVLYVQTWKIWRLAPRLPSLRSRRKKLTLVMIKVCVRERKGLFTWAQESVHVSAHRLVALSAVFRLAFVRKISVVSCLFLARSFHQVDLQKYAAVRSHREVARTHFFLQLHRSTARYVSHL